MTSDQMLSPSSLAIKRFNFLTKRGDIATHGRHPPILCQARRHLWRAERVVVEQDDGRRPGREQLLGQMGADEAGASRH